MALRKFAADFLFTGKEMLDKNTVLITDEYGRIKDIAAASETPDGIERYNGILTPGFINCHCHLELSHMKNTIPALTGMTGFLVTVMNNRSAALEFIRECMEAQEKYMIEKGIVAVGDICNTVHTVPLKRSSSLYFHNFIEAIGFVPSTAELRFAEARELWNTFSEQLSASTIVPHAPYSVSENLFDRIDQHDPGSILTIHNQESEEEAQFLNAATGKMLELYRKLNIDISFFHPTDKSSLQYSLSQISRSHSMILVHNVHTSEEDLTWVNANLKNLPQLWWCFCVNANLYINGKLPDLSLFESQNDRIVVGTDSLASNTQLNILEELKTIQQHFPDISTSRLLRWATFNGAGALRIQSRYGSFEKGKQPGIVVIHGGRGESLAGTVSRRIL